MRNVTVTHRPHIECNLTADDWAMYHLKGREVVATELNRLTEQIINSSDNRQQARRLLEEMIEGNSECGVADTEGYYVIHQILDATFPEAN